VVFKKYFLKTINNFMGQAVKKIIVCFKKVINQIEEESKMN